MINSVEEINKGTLAEGYDTLNEVDKEAVAFLEELDQLNEIENKISERGFGYWLDNCGDDKWYCEHCLQPECGKRMYPKKGTNEWNELKRKEEDGKASG